MFVGGRGGGGGGGSITSYDRLSQHGWCRHAAQRVVLQTSFKLLHVCLSGLPCHGLLCAVAAAGDKPCVIDFMAPWCGKCRMIAPFVDELAEKHQDMVRGVCIMIRIHGVSGSFRANTNGTQNPTHCGAEGTSVFCLGADVER